MKKINFSLIIGVLVITGNLAGCSVGNTPKDMMDHNEPKELQITIPDTFVTPMESEPLTVNGLSTSLQKARLVSGDKLSDVELDQTADYFDQVEKDLISNYSGYKLIETVPSLDTPVCTRQTKELEAAAKLFPDTSFIVVSNDTPFALKRFCLTNSISNIHVLSDARTREFGIENGLFLPEYSLLARSIMIVDNDMTIVYIDYAEEVTSELDLMNALSYLQHLTIKH